MRVGVLVLGLLWAAMATGAEVAADRERARDDEIAALKQQLGVVVGELEKLRTEMGVPEDEALESKYGFGPAAAQVYKLGRGTRIGGYAEGFYRNEIGDAVGDGTDTADMLRAVLYVGHKFTDKLVWNSELEFEHATTGEGNEELGEVSVEFAALDYLWREELGLRAGLLLLPMGFLNEIHEPPFFYGVVRPEVERVIIPTTWRENGVGVFGRLGESAEYRVYAVNGFRASGFSSSGLRDGRQSGSEATAEDVALVARLDLTPLPGLLVGGSLYHGNSGQDETDDVTGIDLPRAATTLWELHGQYQAGGMHVRALFAQADVGSAGRLSQALGLATGAPVAERMLGGYGEVAYDILPLVIPGTELAFEPFVRFEYVDTQHDVPTGFTQDGANRRRIWVPGISFRPHPNVVLKLDYRNIEPFTGEAADELNVGFGLAF